MPPCVCWSLDSESQPDKMFTQGANPLSLVAVLRFADQMKFFQINLGESDE